MKALTEKYRSWSKKVILMFTFLLSGVTLFSQNYFKEIWENMDKSDRFSNMMKLSQFQGIYPGRAITYFLLGNIYEAYMRETDPLVMYDVLCTNYQQFNSYYGLLKLKLDERQANQDREYFGPVEIITDKKKAHLDDILHEIDKRMAGAEEYFNYATKVHNNYVRCITKYNECLFRFREITRAYPDIKTLCLLTDQRLRSDIEKLSLNFDSALVYFNAYKEACKKIPSLQNVNDYQLNEIKTYRLEGLTQADFYAPVVQLWDYSLWADQFIHTLRTDIAAIREGTEKSHRELNGLIDKLKEEAVYYHDEIREPAHDKLHYLTGKYDYASITNDLLTYRKSKLHFLSMIRSGINDPADTREFDLLHKLMFCKDLADAMTELNIQAEMLKKRINTESTSKYLQFFFDHYKGMEGFARWCEMEKADNNRIFDKNLSNLEQFYTIDRRLFEYQDSMMVYNRKKIAFGVQNDPGNSGKDTLITLRVTPFQKKWYYLDGREYHKTGLKTPFLARINPEGKPDWMVTPVPGGMKYTEATSDFLQFTIDSTCWILGSAYTLSADSTRQTVTFKSIINWKGKMVNSNVVESDFTPVYFWVDDINEQYLTVLKGTTSGNSSSGSLPMKIKLFNFNDSLVWEQSMVLNGTFSDLMVTNSDFYVIASFTTLDILSAPGTFSLQSERPGIAGIYIRRNGKISHINKYTPGGKPGNIRGRKVYDNTLQIFSEVTRPDRTKSFLYLLTDNQGKPAFSNDSDLLFETRSLSPE